MTTLKKSLSNKRVDRSRQNSIEDHSVGAGVDMYVLTDQTSRNYSQPCRAKGRVGFGVCSIYHVEDLLGGNSDPSWRRHEQCLLPFPVVPRHHHITYNLFAVQKQR